MRKAIFKNIVIAVLMIFVLCLSFFGVTWAWSNNFFSEEDNNEKLSINYIDGSMVNQRIDGTSQNISFEIINNLSNNRYYNVKLVIDNITNEVVGQYIHYELLDENGTILVNGDLNGVCNYSEILMVYNEIITVGDIQNYTLKIWSEFNEISGLVSAHLVIE